MPCWMTGKYIMRMGQNTDRDLLFKALKRLDMANYAGGWSAPDQFDSLIWSTVDKIVQTGEIMYGETSESRSADGLLSGYQAALEVKREYAREVIGKAAEMWRLEITQDEADEDGLTFFANVREY